MFFVEEFVLYHIYHTSHIFHFLYGHFKYQCKTIYLTFWNTGTLIKHAHQACIGTGVCKQDFSQLAQVCWAVKDNELAIKQL